MTTDVPGSAGNSPASVDADVEGQVDSVATARPAVIAGFSPGGYMPAGVTFDVEPEPVVMQDRHVHSERVSYLSHRAPKGLAISSLVLGIAAVGLAAGAAANYATVLLGAAAVLGVTAAIVGLSAVTKRRSRSLAISGLSLGGCAVLLSFGMFLSGSLGISGYTVAPDVPADPIAESSTGQPEAPSVAGAEAEGPRPRIDPSSYAELDDSEFAAVLADPVAHLDEKVTFYGEVVDSLGPCAFAISADNAQQPTADLYAADVLVFAAYGKQVCPEFDGIMPHSHVQVWAAVEGLHTVDSEGESARVPGFVVRQVVFLADF